jgi:hypothetical protein
MSADIPVEMYEPLATAVGYLILAWGSAENTLGMMITVIYHDLGGKHVEREIPQNFSRKTKFLRRCFNNVAPLKPYAGEALLLLGEATRIEKIRTDIVHGYCADFVPATGKIAFMRLDSEKTIQCAKFGYHTVAELEQAAMECLDLGSKLSAVTQRLAEAFVR